jgi:hypothetical protein
MKSGSDKAIAKQLNVDNDLRDMCGSLKLDALNIHDLRLLTAMYNHVFCKWSDPQGSIAVFDKDGKQVIRYGYAAPPSPQSPVPRKDEA